MPRFISFVVRASLALPAALDRLHLEWGLREIDPMHKDVGYILRRLAALSEDRHA